MGNRSDSGVLRPEDLYRWPDGVQARLGVGRSVYDLVRLGGLKVRAFGRRRFVRGREVIEALGRVSGGFGHVDGDLLRTVDTPATYQVKATQEQPAQERPGD